MLVATFIFTGFGLIDLYLKNTAVKRYEADLTRLASVGTQMLEMLGKHAHSQDFDGFADTFAESGRFRVTIIDADGVVLGDSRLSKESVAKIENHADRLEVIQRGASVLLPRFSGAISLFRASKDSLEIVGSWNGEWKGHQRYDPGKCWSLRTGQLYFSEPASERVSCDHCGAGQFDPGKSEIEGKPEASGHS